MTNQTTEKPIGKIKLSTRRNMTEEERKERCLKTMSSWYNHGYEVMEIEGYMDLSKIHSALHNRFWSPSYGKFGGGVSIGRVEQFDETHIWVEFIYHIGD